MENKITISPAIPLLRMSAKEFHSILERLSSLPCGFTEALFTMAKIWSQCRCPLKDEWAKDDAAHIHNGVLFIHNGVLFSRKEGNPAIYDNVDELRGQRTR